MSTLSLLNTSVTKYFPAKEIVCGLWIGSKGDALDASFMKAHGIKLIVNVSRDIPTPFANSINTYRIPVDDSRSETTAILKHWPITSAAIDDVLAHGGSVLVHCYAGVQRSAATVTAYLMWKYCMGARDAMKVVNGRKAETFVWGKKATFWDSLKQWESELRRQGRVSGRNSSCARMDSFSQPGCARGGGSNGRNTSTSIVMNSGLVPSSPFT